MKMAALAHSGYNFHDNSQLLGLFKETVLKILDGEPFTNGSMRLYLARRIPVPASSLSDNSFYGRNFIEQESCSSPSDGIHRAKFLGVGEYAIITEYRFPDNRQHFGTALEQILLRFHVGESL